MKFSLSAAILIALGAPAVAGGAAFVDGIWVGKGTFQMGDKIYSCGDIKMTFVGSATSYEVREAEMTCEDLGKQTFTEIDKFTIDQDGVITFVEGTATTLKPNTKVGSVKGNRLTTLNPIDDDKIDDIKMRLDGDMLIYDQIASKPCITPDYSLVAILTKQKPAAGDKK
ncbi:MULTISPECIES: hypothetical protein [Rhodopseudomonas]|uniref:Uncharacterized protein n=1 Tax=Rhodopseudomonas palustris TaxID=1076 RepID=A0A0D7EQS5_RHOPL|nr:MULTISPECIES: hypothetical protein [Rhodopseudomonas]KIZ41792.1 hypothetical protein OO17_14205 [Rhodopseudomonas palustris]MDF3810857.1 hypothetical protein [Rhodopseudomonas sp. BAL398]WOK19222.1 hypothetical protein RBJ75_06815 [Rhodopseudomonas sp. BAL398]